MGWIELPGGGQTADAPTAVVFEDRIWLFVRADDGSVWANSGDDDGAWESWEQIGPAGTLASAPSAVAKGGGLYIFGRAPDGSIRTLSRGEYEGWS